jgi:hypothetical protein
LTSSTRNAQLALQDVLGKERREYGGRNSRLGELLKAVDLSR